MSIISVQLCDCLYMVMLRPKKKLCLFPVTCLKILGSVGRKNLFFYFLLFFFKEVITKLFSNQFCFFYIKITVKTVQIGNKCGLWGIFCSTDGKTANLSQRQLSFYGILFSKAIKTLGSQQKIRVGRVTGNTHIFFLRLSRSTFTGHFVWHRSLFCPSVH